MGVASLVLGIMSLVFILVPYAGWLGAVLGIVGIILGAQARKVNRDGVATAGMVCSIIGTVINLLFFLACVMCIAAFSVI